MKEPEARAGGEAQRGALVDSSIHPIQVAILEAMAWLARPVSPVELMKTFDEPQDHYLSAISYHMRSLEKQGAVKEVRTRPVRGAQETFFSLTPKLNSKGEG
jgi:Helix-turn-helix domain